MHAGSMQVYAGGRLQWATAGLTPGVAAHEAPRCQHSALPHPEGLVGINGVLGAGGQKPGGSTRDTAGLPSLV
jgi:hypothetical protein